jgi:hypothetical protein
MEQRFGGWKNTAAENLGRAQDSSRAARKHEKPAATEQDRWRPKTDLRDYERNTATDMRGKTEESDSSRAQTNESERRQYRRRTDKEIERESGPSAGRRSQRAGEKENLQISTASENQNRTASIKYKN